VHPDIGKAALPQIRTGAYRGTLVVDPIRIAIPRPLP